MFACSNFVEALKFLSCVEPVFKFFIFVFKIAAPLPGFTCWKSKTTHGSPSTINVNPVRKSPALIAILITPISLFRLYCINFIQPTQLKDCHLLVFLMTFDIFTPFNIAISRIGNITEF